MSKQQNKSPPYRHLSRSPSRSRWWGRSRSCAPRGRSPPSISVDIIDIIDIIDTVDNIYTHLAGVAVVEEAGGQHQLQRPRGVAGEGGGLRGVPGHRGRRGLQVELLNSFQIHTICKIKDPVSIGGQLSTGKNDSNCRFFWVDEKEERGCILGHFIYYIHNVCKILTKLSAYKHEISFHL